MPSKIQVILASGRALVASVPDNGTAARAIRQSGGGVVVSPEDPHALAKAILNLYKHPQKVKTLGHNSRQYAVEQYAFEQALNQYEFLFSSIVADQAAVESTVVSQQTAIFARREVLKKV